MRHLRPKVKTKSLITNNIAKACDALNQNGLVAIPTETVYGLAANALSDQAVSKIFELKKRPTYNPLIVHLPHIDAIHQVAKNIPEMALKLVKTFWPGPLTLVLEKQPHISDSITAGKKTVAIRVPNHPIALKLLNALAYPLAAPSANPFGCISPTTAQHVAQYFGDTLILEGGSCEKGIESTIIGFNDTPVIYRLGSISKDAIEKVCGPVATYVKDNLLPQAPGMLLQHYAPKTKSYLTTRINAKYLEAFKNQRIGIITFKAATAAAKIAEKETLSPSGDLEEAAKNLYAAMHRLDHAQLDAIIFERLPEIGIGNAINDRLERAVQL